MPKLEEVLETFTITPEVIEEMRKRYPDFYSQADAYDFLGQDSGNGVRREDNTHWKEGRRIGRTELGVDTYEAALELGGVPRKKSKDWITRADVERALREVLPREKAEAAYAGEDVGTPPALLEHHPDGPRIMQGRVWTSGLIVELIDELYPDLVVQHGSLHQALHKYITDKRLPETLHELFLDGADLTSPGDLKTRGWRGERAARTLSDYNKGYIPLEKLEGVIERSLLEEDVRENQRTGRSLEAQKEIGDIGELYGEILLRRLAREDPELSRFPELARLLPTPITAIHADREGGPEVLLHGKGKRIADYRLQNGKQTAALDTKTVREVVPIFSQQWKASYDQATRWYSGEDITHKVFLLLSDRVSEESLKELHDGGYGVVTGPQILDIYARAAQGDSRLEQTIDGLRRVTSAQHILQTAPHRALRVYLRAELEDIAERLRRGLPLESRKGLSLTAEGPYSEEPHALILTHGDDPRTATPILTAILTEGTISVEAAASPVQTHELLRNFRERIGGRVQTYDTSGLPGGLLNYRLLAERLPPAQTVLRETPVPLQLHGPALYDLHLDGDREALPALAHQAVETLKRLPYARVHEDLPF